MTENDIQKALESAVGNPNWHENIAGQLEVEKVAATQSHELFIPSFPIDYLVRKRLVSAAKHVLERLRSATVASTSKSNISLTAPSATFYPDLVLIDEGRGQLIIVELKRSKQTERQALTELLAYEHEIRNYIPFLSNLDLSFVLVSTEFSPLLEHSIAALTTWESKQILCLKADTSAGLALSVHLPEPWTAIGQHTLPENAIPTLTLRLDTSSDDPDSEGLLKVLEPATQLIAREGDRIRSHGFVMLWQDSWFGRITDSRFCLTLGFLNPYVFLPDAIETGMLSIPNTTLANFLLDSERLLGPQNGFGPFAAVAEKAIEVLRDYSEPEWELHTDWRQLRQFSSPIRHRAIPLFIEFWGSIGEYARELVVHPAARQHFMPEIKRRALMWNDRSVAVPILDQISGVSLFDGGEFWCSDLFHFGARLGALASACATLREKSEAAETNVAALFEWAKADIVSALREIQYRYMAANELNVPPPTITLRPSEMAGEMIQEIEALANWINDEFLGPNNEAQRSFFSLGLSTFQLLDEAFQTDRNTEMVEFARRKAVSSMREFLTNVASEIDNQQLASATSEKLRSLIAAAFRIKDEEGALGSALQQAPDTLFLQNFPAVFLACADELLPPAMHELALPASMEVVDWDWMKEQIAKLRSQGVRYPAVQLNPDGAFVTTILNEDEGAMLRPMDADTEVFFVNNFSGFRIGVITNWTDLISGKVLKTFKDTAES